jgi:hypothetical protein
MSTGSAVPVPHRLGFIPDGVPGVRLTLAIMVDIVKVYKANALIRQAAQRLVRNCSSRDAGCQVSCIHAYVRDGIIYLPDVRDVETLQTPDYTLQEGSGDCDDQSILVASLLESIGFETRFCAIGVQGEFFSHVSSQVRLGRAWVNLETILQTLPQAWGAYPAGVPMPVGWFPPDATCIMLRHV